MTDTHAHKQIQNKLDVNRYIQIDIQRHRDRQTCGERMMQKDRYIHNTLITIDYKLVIKVTNINNS